jgi:hypothetical protein
MVDRAPVKEEFSERELDGISIIDVLRTLPKPIYQTARASAKRYFIIAYFLLSTLFIFLSFLPSKC